MKSSDWNALTQALYAIDQILQYIKQNQVIYPIQTQVAFAGINATVSTSISTSAGTGNPP